ncbi:MAG: hypothetical protein JSU74_12485 [Candidatus Zixiibacteriota bacterium]|nr:MAG: hypothetical protein JSU74_12485 [candidate division Zixibacteria bacterium]
MKKKTLKSDSSYWAAALLVTFLTSVQALVALPLHKVEIHIISTTPSAQDPENLEMHLPYQQAMLSFDSSKSSTNKWVFTSRGRVLKWGEEAVARSQLRGSNHADTIPISWPLESLFDLFSPRVEEWLGLPGEKSRIRINTFPQDARLRIVYTSFIGDTILDTFSEGDTASNVRAGGQMRIHAEADRYIAQSFDCDVDSAMVLEIKLAPVMAAVTVKAFDLSGNEEINAEILIDSQLTRHRPFKEFPLDSDRSYTIFVRLDLGDGLYTSSDTCFLRLSPGVDTSISCTLRPTF